MSSVLVTIDFEILNRLLHDRWFDLDRVQYDKQQQTVRMDIGVSKRQPVGELQVTINSVLDLAVEDQAKIKVYDISRVEIRDSVLIVESGFPLRLIMRLGHNSMLSVSS
jgi:hypothetical protein